MAKTKIRNVSPGGRIVWSRKGDDAPTATLIPGGAEVEVENFDQKSAQAYVDAGDLVVGGGEAKEVDMEERFINDPFQVQRREAAEAAAKTLADPLPDEDETKRSAKADTGEKRHYTKRA